jgi:Alpha/beta hydrolase family
MATSSPRVRTRMMPLTHASESRSCSCFIFADSTKNPPSALRRGANRLLRRAHTGRLPLLERRDPLALIQRFSGACTHMSRVHSMSRSSFVLTVAVVAVVAPAFGGCSRWAHAVVASQQSPPRETQMLRVVSKDGTLVAVECAGAGPTLLIVHGGIGNRTRWTPMFPLLASHFTVCAMDRRGHGLSGDSPDYSLQKEAEDVASVVDSRPGAVFVLGHSYGGVAALEWRRGRPGVNLCQRLTRSSVRCTPSLPTDWTGRG